MAYRQTLTFIAAFVAATTAFAQSTTVVSIEDQTPAENASGASVRLRSPGNWVQAALSRHDEVLTDRLRAARFGTDTQDNTTNEGTGSTGDSTTGSSGSLGTSDLLDLINSFGGGTGDLSGLAGLLGGPGASTLLSGITGLGNGSVNSSGQPQISSLTGGSSKTLTSATLDAEDQSSDTVVGGAIGRLPKRSFRQQSTDDGTTDEPSFQIRLANSLLTTFFTSIGVGLQSSAFINSLKDMLRPIVRPDLINTADSGSDGSTDGSTDGTGGSQSGGGIEDPTGGGDGNTDGSVI